MCIGIINNFNYYEKYNECVGSDQIPIYEIFQNKSQCSTQLWKKIMIILQNFFLSHDATYGWIEGMEKFLSLVTYLLREGGDSTFILCSHL